jgi:2,4-dienoyl-CoA reductase-like NADH-dependent reductase (Old Yellow Enzyme family)
MTNKNLFSPFKTDKLELQNRIVMAPMTRQYSPGNIPNDLNIAYYARRAEHGVGLIITEGTCVGHKGANGYENVPFFYGEKALEGWRQIAEAVHAFGGKIMPQLWHVGAIRKDEGQEPDPTVPGYSPSGLIKPGRDRGVAMTEQDCADVIEAFAQAAADAQNAGFDGVEIHGAHGYLIDQFFWAGTNKRTDKYGGDRVARTKFGTEIVSAIRQSVGESFPIVLRYSQWKMQDYEAKLAPSPAELEQFLAPLTDAGVDIFHASTRRFWEPEFEGSDLNLAGWTQKITGKPTITVGSVGLSSSFINEDKRNMADTSGSDAGNFENLFARIGAGEFDLVAVGRALLQDPLWVEKVRDGRMDEMQDYSQETLKKLY